MKARETRPARFSVTWRIKPDLRPKTEKSASKMSSGLPKKVSRKEKNSWNWEKSWHWHFRPWQVLDRGSWKQFGNQSQEFEVSELMLSWGANFPKSQVEICNHLVLLQYLEVLGVFKCYQGNEVLFMSNTLCYHGGSPCLHGRQSFLNSIHVDFTIALSRLLIVKNVLIVGHGDAIGMFSPTNSIK